MKVSGTGRSSGPSAPRRSGKAQGSSGSGFASHLQNSTIDASDSTHGIDAPQALSGIESLLAVQSVDEDGQGRGKKRMLQHGEEMLDRLEDIRRGLLLGTIPKSRLSQLAQMVRNKRDAGADPELSAILDEIELRAEVELAKLSR
jgi:hypothetical protein